MMDNKTHCQTLSHYDENSVAIYKNKLKYLTHDDAVKAAKKINIKEGQIYKTVTYKCPVCHTYHIGRNGTKITEKYRKKLLDENVKLKFNTNFKIIGKINL